MPTTNYLWDPETDSCLMETDESGATTAAYTNEPAPFGPLISQHRDDETSYYHYDALGSTRQLTDASETVINTNLYDAWGVNVDSTGSMLNPFQWAGQSGYYFDSTTARYGVRSRGLSSQHGRWLCLDPQMFSEGPNRYTYVLNRPTRLLDPSGLECGGAPRGIVYRKRGVFRAVTLGPRDPSADFLYHRIGSDFQLNYFARIPGRGDWEIECMCCCTKVGLVQTVTQRSEPWIRGDSPWVVDGGIPYPFANSINPCDRGSLNPHIHENDSPNFPRLYHPRSFTQQFEVCAVCLEGNEGPEWSVEGDWDRQWHRVLGLTVYGCIQWGHTLKQTSVPTRNVTVGRDEYYDVQIRYIRHGGGMQRHDPATGEAVVNRPASLAPSPNFQFAIATFVAPGLPPL